jgi:hypothetical protein
VCRFHVATGAKLRPGRGVIYKLSGAVAKLACINLQKLFFSSTGSINLGFILRKDLLLCLSYISLRVPNWTVIYTPPVVCHFEDVCRHSLPSMWHYSELQADLLRRCLPAWHVAPFSASSNVMAGTVSGARAPSHGSLHGEHPRRPRWRGCGLAREIPAASTGDEEGAGQVRAVRRPCTVGFQAALLGDLRHRPPPGRSPCGGSGGRPGAPQGNSPGYSSIKKSATVIETSQPWLFLPVFTSMCIFSFCHKSKFSSLPSFMENCSNFCEMRLVHCKTHLASDINFMSWLLL